MEEIRKQFEQWAEEAGALPWGYLKKQRNPSGGYSIQIYTYMWKAWQASRRELVVELPVILGDGLVARTLMVAIKDCTERLQAAGITVKGEGE